MYLSKEIEERVAKAFSNYWYSLPDPALMNLMLQTQYSERMWKLRTGTWIGVAILLAFIPVDQFAAPDIADILSITRISISLFALFAIEIIYKISYSLFFAELFVAFANIFAASSILLLATGSESFYSTNYNIFGTLFVFSINIFFNLRNYLSIFTSIYVCIIYTFSTLCQGDGFENKISSLYFLSCLIFSIYISYRSKREQYVSFVNYLKALIEHNASKIALSDLQRLSETDPLTGLANRRGVERVYDMMCSPKPESISGLGTVLIDVDYFKGYNDYLGHQAGDECLAKISQVLALIAATYGGSAGRVGGDEFVLILPVANEVELLEIANFVCCHVEDLELGHPARRDGRKTVTVSAGALFTQMNHKLTLFNALEFADLALYESKLSGRGKAALFDETSSKNAHSSRKIEGILRVALAEELVSVAYQPIFELEQDKPRGHEALMRLRDADGRLISPADFIPVAERQGTIVPLSYWLLEQACKDLACGLLGDFVSINVSPQVMMSGKFVFTVSLLLSKYGICPNRVAFELTESVDIANQNEVIQVFKDLRTLGVQIWLDDFGAGYAGFSWLRWWDFDVVKLDRELLWSASETRGKEMLTALTRFLRRKRRRVIIEGVESTNQLQLARRLKVEMVQGFLIGKPEFLKLPASLKTYTAP